MRNKKGILISMVIIIILLGCGMGYYVYQSHAKQADIDSKINRIEESEKAFSTTQDRSEKYDILKSMVNEMNKYNQSSKKNAEVSDKYESTISNIQKVFKEEYDNIIKENNIENLDTAEDIDTINTCTENLNTLSSTIESEKEYTLSADSEYNTYIEQIATLTDKYNARIKSIEEQQKAEEEAKKLAEEESRRKAEEEKAKTHYENDYFSVDVPKSWIDCWSVTENNSSDGNTYSFDYTADSTYGGGATIYVVDATYGLPQNGSVIKMGCELVGYTTNNFGVFSVEAGAGFFTQGATITLK